LFIGGLPSVAGGLLLPPDVTDPVGVAFLNFKAQAIPEVIIAPKMHPKIKAVSPFIVFGF